MNDEPNRAPAPQASGAAGASRAPIPRGIEVLLKKASVDPKFRALLLEQRAGAAAAIDLKLELAEVAMLRAIPADQLERLIDHTKVPVEQRRVFLGRAAAAMLAVIGAALAMSTCTSTLGHRAGRLGGLKPRPNESTNRPPVSLARGISPDRP